MNQARGSRPNYDEKLYLYFISKRNRGDYQLSDANQKNRVKGFPFTRIGDDFVT